MIFSAIQKMRFNNTFFKYALTIIIVSLNIVGLIISSLKPARHGDLTLIKDIVQLEKGDKTTVLSYNYTNPINPWGLPVRFYYNKEYTDIRFDEIEDIKHFPFVNHQYFLTLKKKDLTDKTREMITDLGFVKYSQSIPQWMEPALNVYGDFNLSQIVVLYVREDYK